MSDNVIQISLLLPPIRIEDLDGISSTTDLLKMLAAHQDSEGWKLEAAVHMQSVHSFGNSLELILDEVDNPFEKAQALRKLVEDMRKYGHDD